MEATIPHLKDHLPDLFESIRTLAQQIEAGELRDGDELALRILDFYTLDRMEAIEIAAPGWQAMAAIADGATLNHVTQALVALQLLPEYRQASPRLQALMEWSVLYHDLGKQVIGGQRDAVHAFRSAALAARALPELGFLTSEASPRRGLCIRAARSTPRHPSASALEAEPAATRPPRRPGTSP